MTRLPPIGFIVPGSGKEVPLTRVPCSYQGKSYNNSHPEKEFSGMNPLLKCGDKIWYHDPDRQTWTFVIEGIIFENVFDKMVLVYIRKKKASWNNTSFAHTSMVHENSILVSRKLR